MRDPFVLRDGSAYRMWYGGFDGTRNRILRASSTDGLTWTRDGVVFDVLVAPHHFDSVVGQSVMKDGPTYRMWFTGGFWSGGPAGLWAEIYTADSTDSVSWTVRGVALGLGPAGSWDDSMVHWPSVVKDRGGTYWMYYVGWDGTPGGTHTQIGLATSSDGASFTRVGTAPVLSVEAPPAWDDALISTPSVILGSPIEMWYSGAGLPTLRIGVATSTDGLAWTRLAGNPVFSEGPPDSWDDAGVHGEQILFEGAEKRMYYTGSDGSSNRIGLARLVAPQSGTVDCDPNTINLRARGRWITCYLEPEPGRSAGDVVAVTVRLDSWLAPALDEQHGFAFAPGGYLVDHDGDGVFERLLKFDRQAIADVLGPGEHVFLVEGTYSDGVGFRIESEVIHVIG